MMPSSVTDAPTMPVAAAKIVAQNITARYSAPCSLARPSWTALNRRSIKPACSSSRPMNTNSGTEASVCSRITWKNWNTIRWNTVSPNPRYPKMMPRRISVKAIGNPAKIVSSSATSIQPPMASGLMAQHFVEGAGGGEPLPGAKCVEALQEFRQTLQQQQRRRHRNHRFQRIDDRHPRAADRALVADPRVPRELAADPEEDRNPGEEQQQVAKRVHRRLRLHGPFLIQEIGADMRAAVERVRGAEHEHRAVHHVAE